MVTQSYTIVTSAELAADIRAIDQTGSEAAPDTAYTFTFANSVTLSQPLDAINLDAGSSLTILGNNDTLDGGGTYNGLFAYQGTLDVQNLTIADAHAVGGAGGAGNNAGGGGAGLGGGLFVAAGAVVSLAGVDFLNDAATGGAGGADGGQGPGGGGGLLRGAGAPGESGTSSGGGGGGIGGDGGSGQIAGQAGLVPGAASGGSGYKGGKGGASGGGGGGGYAGGQTIGGGGSSGGGGGGGGIAGRNGTALSQGGGGGTGGFGGGGGGYGDGYGNGGFGGGGGGYEGRGGFGGGGGASDTEPQFRLGGFGGGNGGGPSGGTGGGGGGGLGAGGDIFVQQGGLLLLQGGTLGVGNVTGGAGVAGGNPYGGQGASSTAGDAFGSSLFIQGNETVTLAPGAGEALTVAGTIADEHGSISSYKPEGTLAIDGAGTVNLDATNTFSGGIQLEAGTLALGAAGAAGSGPISFGGRSLLGFAYGESPTNVINDFAAGDTIEITNFAGFPAATASYNSPNLVIVGLTEITVPLLPPILVDASVTLDVPGLKLAELSINNVGFETFLTTTQAVCFAAGTSIATPLEQRLVEQLAPGEAVLAAGPDGLWQPQVVRWIGRRTLDLASHPEPELAAPIRIRAGAIAPGLPVRDLLLSPDHCLLLDGHLLRAFRLLNGVSVVQERPASVTYVHVELDQHALLLAEGMAAESYLEEGHRGFFEGGMALPGPLHDRTASACAPFVADDTFAARLWQAVAGRAGVATPAVSRSRLSTSALRLRAGGRMLKPVLAAHDRCQFALPPGATSVSLQPPTARPTDTRPWLDDRRSLGVMVSRVRVHAGAETTDIALDGPQIGGGWHGVERAGQRPARWTGGNAELWLPPCASAAILELTIAGAMVNAEPRQEAA